jgi:hypothetical protein
MLALLDFVLRHYPALESFERSTRSLSSLLFPPPSLLLSEACALGNTALLDLVWAASCTRAEDRRPGWSLTNYLRSDPHYYRWQFVKSLYEAAGRGDLAVVEWLFAHFAGVEAPEDVVLNAARFGHLRVFRFLFERRSGERNEAEQTESVRAGVTNQCCVNLGGFADHRRDGESLIRESVANGQLAQCLDDGMVLDDDDRDAAIEEALCTGEFKLADRLLPPGRPILDYATHRSRPEILVKVLDAGCWNWNEQLAERILPHAARSGTCALMQQILQLHSPLREDHSRWKSAWSFALEKACSGGNMSVVAWLMEHPLGHEACEQMKEWIAAGEGSITTQWFTKAALKDNVEVMQYLYEKGLAELSPFVKLCIIRKGQLNTVKWLAEHDMIGSQEAFNSVVKEAAEYGRLDILQLFQTLDEPGGYEAVGLKRRRTAPAFSFWGGYQEMFRGAVPGGQVAVLEWLQAIYPTHCQADAKDAAYSTQLDAVKRLGADQTEDWPEMAMYVAIQNNPFDVVKWLYVNLPESRSGDDIAMTIAFGHVRIAYWLHSKCPDFDLNEYLRGHHEALRTHVDRLMDNPLEALLFLRAVYPSKFTQGVVVRVQDDCEQQHPSFARDLTLSWLEENYPSTPATAPSWF